MLCAAKQVISMEFLEAMEPVVPNIEQTLDRFMGNQALWSKFVRRFPEDESFPALSAALRRGDYADAERSAHTLKGVAGNLGFESLFSACNALVKALRENKEAEYDADFDAVEASYRKVLEAVGMLDPA